VSNGITLTTVIITLVFQGGIGTILGMITSIQLFFLMPGMPINFPSNLMAFFEALFPFVAFDYIPPDYTTANMFTFDDERDKVYNDQLG